MDGVLKLVVLMGVLDVSTLLRKVVKPRITCIAIHHKLQAVIVRSVNMHA